MPDFTVGVAIGAGDDDGVDLLDGRALAGVAFIQIALPLCRILNRILLQLGGLACGASTVGAPLSGVDSFTPAAAVASPIFLHNPVRVVTSFA